MLKVEDLPSVRQQMNRVEVPAEEGAATLLASDSTSPKPVQAFNVADLPDIKKAAEGKTLTGAAVEYARAPDGPGFQLGAGRPHATQRNAR